MSHPSTKERCCRPATVDDGEQGDEKEWFGIIRRLAVDGRFDGESDQHTGGEERYVTGVG